MSRTRYRIFDSTAPYFLTCTVVGWLPIFTRPECADIVFKSWDFLQRTGRMTLYGYVVLENHLHFIASGEQLAKEVGDFKSYTARRIIDFLHDRADHSFLAQLEREKAGHKNDRRYQLWQEGSHPKQINTDEMMEQKLEYIHSNPVKRGFVEEPQHWRYSSARNYHGLTALLDIEMNWR